MEKLYTVKDVATITGFTERTIRNYIRDGRLRGKKIGVQWRFSEDDVKRLFEDEGVSTDITKSNHDRILEFIKGKVEPNKGAIVLNVPVADKEKLGEKVQQMTELMNKNVDLRFTFQYFDKDGIAQFILIGDIRIIQEFIGLRGMWDE